MKYETITQPLLVRVRQFCQNQWPCGKSDEQCDITSVFLIRLFGGVLQGGFNYEGGKEIPGGGGYRDARGVWQLHYWAELRGSVIDLTSDQFPGGAPIVFEPVSGRYRSTFPDEHLKNATQQQGVKLAAWLRNWAAYSNPTMARQHRFLLVRDHHPEKLLPPRLTVPEIEAILKHAQRLYPNSWISWTCVEEDKRLRPMNHTSNTRSSGCGSRSTHDNNHPKRNMSSMYQAVTALGLRFTFGQLNAAARQLWPIPTRKVRKASLKPTITGTKNNFEVVRLNGLLICDGLAFDRELAAITYSRFPRFRDQEAGVFEIDHEDGVSTAYLCDPGRAIRMLFEFPAIVMVSGEDGEEIVVATTDKKLILVDETDDPYSSYDKRISLADAVAAAPALNELAANLQKRGLPKVLPLVISLRKYAG